MKHSRWLILLVVILLCRGSFAENWTSCPVITETEIIDSAIPSRDDPQPDTLFYDNGNGEQYYPHQLYSCTWFTTPEDFELRSIYFHPCNPNNNRNLGCNVYVFTANNNGLPDEELWSIWLEPPIRHGWIQVDIPEDNYIRFNAQDDFNIIYGPSSAGQDGWWNFLDGATIVNRSFISDNLEIRWAALGGDLLIRAGGDILSEFVDLGVDVVANESEKFFLNCDEPISYYAEVTNYGEIDVEDFTLTFTTVTADGGDEIWSHTVECEGLEIEETVTVQAEEDYDPFDMAFYVWVTVDANRDANEDNDRSGLEQITCYPDTVGGNEGIWFGYTDGETENGVRGRANGGFGVMFYPPDEQTVRVTKIHAILEPWEFREVEFRAYIYNGENYDLRWSGMVDPLMDQWLEIDVSEEEGLTAFRGEGILVAYMYSEDIMMRFDTDQPVAGTNSLMPSTMFQSENDGESWEPQNTGDYSIEIKLAYSNELPPYGLLDHSPDELDFGIVDRPGQSVDRELYLYNDGGESVAVNNIYAVEPHNDEFTFNETEFEIAVSDSHRVIVTWEPDEEELMETNIVISNNSNQELYAIPACGNSLDVDEKGSPIPARFRLLQNHPNPFNGTTRISFVLQTASHTQLTIYDISGVEVANLINGILQSGNHTINWDAVNNNGTPLPTGLYFANLQADKNQSLIKTVLIR